MERLAEPQVDSSHYFEGYDSFARFASYWHQIDETATLGGHILEVGIGNGTVAAVLRARGLEVTTVDIDPALNPDVVADIRNLPFAPGSFDSALSAEVLEHLPWEDVQRAVGELARVVRRGLVVSVPDSDVAFAVYGRIPNAAQILRMTLRRRLPVRSALWALSQRVSWRRSGGDLRQLAGVERVHQETGPHREHYWEIGLGGMRPGDFVAVVEATGLRLLRDYRGLAFPYHHFFVFERPSPSS